MEYIKISLFAYACLILCYIYIYIYDTGKTIAFSLWHIQYDGISSKYIGCSSYKHASSKLFDPTNIWWFVLIWCNKMPRVLGLIKCVWSRLQTKLTQTTKYALNKCRPVASSPKVDKPTALRCWLTQGKRVMCWECLDFCHWSCITNDPQYVE